MHEQGNVPSVIRFGPFTFDGRSGELRNGATRLRVPDQSLAILQALLERPGELVTREALRDRLWGPDTFVDFEAGLNAAVRRLREALNDSADTPRYVETLPRRGYRFIAPVDVVSTGLPAPLPVMAPADASPAAPAGPVPGRRAARAKRGAAIRCPCAPRRGAVGRTEARQGCTDRIGSEAVSDHTVPGIGARAGNVSGREPRRFCLGRQEGRQLRHLRAIDRWQVSLQLTTDPSPDHAPAWSPDGQRIAFIRVVAGRRKIMAIPALGGPEEQLFEASGTKGAPRKGAGGPGRLVLRAVVDADGKHLVFGDRTPASPQPSICIRSRMARDGG